MQFENFNEITAKRPYTYRRNPLHDHSFIILKQEDDAGEYQPVGDYTLLDTSEDRGLTEKKVMNLIALMNNDEDSLIDLRSETNLRVLYFKAPSDEPDKTRIIFYTLGEKGVSVENAVLSMNEELADA
jgi:hypothetical protein